MRITLNLATRPFADLGPAIKRLRIAMGVLAFISILLGFGLQRLHTPLPIAIGVNHHPDRQWAFGEYDPLGQVLDGVDRLSTPANEQADILTSQ